MQEQEQINTKINFGSASFKKYFANTGWMFGEKIVRLLLTFFVGIYIVRYLGPEQFGLLGYALGFVGLFSTISTLGLDGIVTRELVKTPGKKDVLLGTAFILRLVGAVVSVLLLSIGIWITQDDSFTVIMMFIIASASFFQTFGVIEYFFQSRVEAKYAVIIQFASVLLTSLIKLIFIFSGASLIYFAIAAGIEFVFLAIGFVIIYKKRSFNIFDWSFSKSVASSLLKDSWPLILSGMVVAIYVKIDQVLIKNMMGNEPNGYYTAAARLCEAWYFIPIAITNSLFPAVINAKQTSEVLYKSRLQKLYDIVTWLAVLIALPVTFFSEEIITFLLGEKFLPSAPVFVIYIWAGVAVFLGVASSRFLILENLTKLSFYRTAMGMVINVILNLILIPKYGIIGSAYATLISYSAATFSIGISRTTFHQLGMMLKSILFINFYKFIIILWQSRLKKK